jgi:RNA polymerase sigma-70 factor (ECF subfamily)
MTEHDSLCVPAHAKAEFNDLLSKHWHHLFNLIFCVVQNLADTEDIFQQTTMALWADFAKFEPGTDFRAWASQVARYRISNFVRAKRRQRVYFSDELVDQLSQCRSESKDVHDARLAALASCREKLSPPDQELVGMCYGQGERICDVAERIGRPATLIYARLAKIRAGLLACIERSLAHEEFS